MVKADKAPVKYSHYFSTGHWDHPSFAKDGYGAAYDSLVQLYEDSEYSGAADGEGLTPNPRAFLHRMLVGSEGDVDRAWVVAEKAMRLNREYRPDLLAPADCHEILEKDIGPHH